MNQSVRDLATLKELGNRRLAEREYVAAATLYEEAARLSEIPRGGLCVRLARAYVESGRPEAAAAALMPVVDAAPSFKTWAKASALLSRCPVETWPAVRRRLDVALIGTWTTSTFAPLLRLAAARYGVALNIREPDFGQYFNATLDPDSMLYREPLDAVILAPDHRSLGLKPFTDDPAADVAAAVERWSGVWDALRRHGSPIVVQHGFATAGADPLGHFASGLSGARRSVVAEINRELARRAAESDVGFLDLQALAGRFGADQWFDDRGWYMAKIPYGPEALPQLARHTAAVLGARLGFSRRCVVLDLDNTLWGGVIGDDGLDGISLGGGAVGEAYVDFQIALKELKERGILLAVCSKNDEAVARSPFRQHPEMVLREDDFAAFVANWDAKSAGIGAIATALDLGLDSFTFLDDNPYERAEVRRALPQVDVPQLPEDPVGFRRAIEDYPYFEPSAFTDADRARAEQYRARARAISLQASAGSIEEYQAGLGMRAQFGSIDAVNAPRVVQLLNKTNQFNLTTRRRNKAELEDFLAAPGALGFWVRLSDRFADHGLIAVALAVVRQQDGARVLEIDTLLMSCRVLGRGVETLIVAELGRAARDAGCATVVGRYIATGRNGMVADLFPKLGFQAVGKDEGRSQTWRIEPAALDAGHVPIELVWV